MEKYGFFLKSSFDKSVHLSDQQKGIEYPPLEKPPPSDARLISLISPDNLSVAKKTGYSEYVGNLGVAILDGFREIGIGTEMMKTLVSKAENMGLKMLTLSVFSTNKRAKHVYEKIGFRETGCIPNELYKNGKFIDHIIMVKEVT